MGHRTIEYLTALEVLADGEWHDREKVIRRIAEAVPPGKALRMAESLRVQQLKKDSVRRFTKTPGFQPRRVEKSMEEQIKIGGRAIARSILNGKNQRIKTSEDRTQVRLLPSKQRNQSAISKQGWSSRRNSGQNWRERLEARGIDPSPYSTFQQYVEERKARMADMTPEELSAFYKQNSLKSWESRKKNREGYDDVPDLPGSGGPQGSAQA